MTGIDGFPVAAAVGEVTTPTTGSTGEAAATQGSVTEALAGQQISGLRQVGERIGSVLSSAFMQLGHPNCSGHVNSDVPPVRSWHATQGEVPPTWLGDF